MDKPSDKGSAWDLVTKALQKAGSEKRKAVVALMLIAALLTIAFVHMEITRTGYAVSLNGMHIGTVKDKEMAAEVLSQLGTEILEHDEGLVLTAELKVERVKLQGQLEEVLDEKGLREELRKNIELRKKAITLCINGNPVLSVTGIDKAQNLLDRVKECFIPKEQDVDICGIDIKERVDLLDDPVEPENIMDPEDAYKFLINGTTESKMYTVSRGDSLWAISRDHNILVEDLEKANPEVDPKKLQIGQQLSMIVPKPFVTVVTEEIAVLKEDIPYLTKYKDSSDFYKGESIVQTAGRYGQKEVTARIIRENGIESDRVILEEKVIREPVTRIIATGTKPPPPRQGTGTFAYPATGRITSGFGRRWGRMHNGIDIGIPTGTPVKASDGGTVVFSGRQGNYGNLVILDHGEGFTTYYGHNSELLVSKGDKVHKGQTIAMSGNTGNTTGPHLHFEIRKFNVPVNPMNYL